MVTCKKCGHSWTPRSLNKRLTCSQCGSKVTVGPPEIVVHSRNVPLDTECSVCGAGMQYLNVCRVDGDPALVCDTCLARFRAVRST